ncbi:MAG: 16S rRNA (guanine(966)-N(2))-methyltransferase RsmD [Clostridia bacterium]|nr:16S rRNA (guanine(966)-N(2))-methyltransferase RsmD [Clostridia bacterium]
MRVISGTARGKRLHSLEGLETRPTLDRVKEAVFNILQFNLKNASVLDLFSGSGALAIEALSRGAKEAVLCDNSYKAIQIINKNLEETKLIDKAEVVNKDYFEALKYLQSRDKEFDIIFLDPPYKSKFAINSIENIMKFDLLKDEGIIILETDDKNKIETIKKLENIEVYDERKYGIVLVIFIRKG